MSDAKPSLLVVDDEVDTCQNLSDIFTDLGHRVDVAYDGPTALDKLRQTRFDVVLLDLMMPGMDGLALYREIKRLRPETVAVLATAYPNHPRAEAGLQAGIWRIVPKPVEITGLLKMIDEAMDVPVVLVVDDDRDLCDNLWDVLRERGYRVGIAHDARTAAELLRHNGFKVLLIDMRLPDADGAEVFRTARQIEPHAGIVIITGHSADLAPSLAQLKKEGADALCYKPFDMDELLSTVERLGRS